MSYRISENGAVLLEDTARFCKREIIAESAKWDKEGLIPEKSRKALCELGYQALTVPESFGGLGLSAVDVAAILEEIAKADAGMAVTLAGSNLALRAVLTGGTQSQIDYVCRVLSEGGLGAFCLTEAGAGSDASAIATAAVVQPDGSYVLNGNKLFITNGSVADFYCVAAKIAGQQELSLFLVPADTNGLTAGAKEDKLGIRSSDTCEVSFVSCRVDADALVGGREGRGLQNILAALNEGRAYAAAMAIGVAQRALDEAVQYSKLRVQFGKPICQHQSVSMKLAEMQIKIEAARQLTAHALELMDNGEDFAAYAAMAKSFAGDTAVEVTGKVMDIFGGYGYSREYPVEKLLRDARVFKIIEGTDEMQKLLIGNWLLKQKVRQN